MDAQFWIKVWNEGRINFHQENYHDKLLEYFPQLNPKKGQRVLVPLCGKSKDLLWLHALSLQVHGVELHEQAVEAFFKENDLSPVKKIEGKTYTEYSHRGVMISCGDFFKLNKEEFYDFIYDRASLVALPAAMRKGYAQVIKKSLKKGGKCLLIAYEYDQSKLEGPPFSVNDSEIHELYEDQLTINLMERKSPTREGARLAALEDLKQKIYILEKVR